MRRSPSQLRALLVLAVALALLAALLVAGGTRVTGQPPVAALLDPADGLYRHVRLTDRKGEQQIVLEGLDGPVEVVRDERGVPHIYASTDRDAVRAFGFVTAQDRLFQMDFIPRVASGRLSEAVGEAAADYDRYLRETGMEWGARRNLARIEREQGISFDLLTWYTEGVNAYLDGLAPGDLPLEFQLLGYAPNRWSPLQTMRMLQYMAHNLSYDEREPQLSALRARMDEASFDRFFPEHSPIVVPIVPTPGGGAQPVRRVEPYPDDTLSMRAGGVAEAFVPGKGSNNWAVAGARSATGMPILAGDMHLQLTLPAIWYEAHLVTPTMNTYGVAVPGAPLPVESFNDHLGWAFTNTGADQIDHYRLEVNSAGTQYRFDGLWHDFVLVPDTLHVLRGEARIDTLRYTHLGPVQKQGDTWMAVRWTAHEPSNTLQALWEMNHATTYSQFESALRHWDTPMQNILYAGRDGRIAIRSTGHLPVRADSTGAGLRDGTTSRTRWIGRVPFDQLPHVIDPAQGFLSSTNQDPTDAAYPYYLGRDWYSNLRSLRIDSLLRSKAQHTVEDLVRYQSDVRAMHHALLMPMLDTLTHLSPRADTLLQMLRAWNGDTDTDRPEPTVLYHFLRRLDSVTWDEPVFRIREPAVTPHVVLLRDTPDSPWLDRPGTPRVERAADILRLALELTADTLDARYGWSPDAWRWGAHHGVVFRHLTQSDALKALWRGPMEYPGFSETLSPASGLTTTHSASWRVVLDFSTTPVEAYGIYPGGQSGNPFSRLYDLHLERFVRFEPYRLYRPLTADAIPSDRITSRLTLTPPVTR